MSGLTATTSQPFVVEYAMQTWKSGSGDGEIVHVLEAWRLKGPGVDELAFGQQGEQRLRRRADELNRASDEAWATTRGQR